MLGVRSSTHEFSEDTTQPLTLWYLLLVSSIRLSALLGQGAYGVWYSPWAMANMEEEPQDACQLRFQCLFFLTVHLKG